MASSASPFGIERRDRNPVSLLWPPLGRLRRPLRTLPKLGAVDRGELGRIRQGWEYGHLAPEAFGQAAREIRKERGLSQEQAALNGGIDRANYGHIERASKNATVKTIWKMAAALSTRPSDLLIRANKSLRHGRTPKRPWLWARSR